MAHLHYAVTGFARMWKGEETRKERKGECKKIGRMKGGIKRGEYKVRGDRKRKGEERRKEREGECKKIGRMKERIKKEGRK